MLTYWNDPRYRNERLMIYFAVPIAIVLLIWVGYLTVIQLKNQKEEMARLTAVPADEQPTPTPLPDTAVQKGKKAFAEKNFYTAKVQLEHAMEFPSQRSEAANFLGAIANQENDYEKAIRYFTVALDRNPEARLYFNRGEALRRVGRVPEALDDFRQAVAIEPGNALFSNKLGILRIANGETAQIREELRLKNDFKLTQTQKSWIVIEALMAMKENHFTEAAACLNVGALQLSASTFSALLQDPELLYYQARPELLRYYLKNQRPN